MKTNQTRIASLLLLSVLSMDMTAANAGMPQSQPVYGYNNVMDSIQQYNQYGQPIDSHNAATNPTELPPGGNRVLGTDLSTIADEHRYYDQYENQYMPLFRQPPELQRSKTINPKINQDKKYGRFMADVQSRMDEQERRYQQWRMWTRGTSLEGTSYPGSAWVTNPKIMETLRKQNPDAVRRGTGFGAMDPQTMGAMGNLFATMMGA